MNKEPDTEVAYKFYNYNNKLTSSPQLKMQFKGTRAQNFGMESTYVKILYRHESQSCWISAS